MSLEYSTPEFTIIRDEKRCINCQVCVRQCANEAHYFDEEEQTVYSDDSKCVSCHRCVTLCPAKALSIKKNEHEFRANAQLD